MFDDFVRLGFLTLVGVTLVLVTASYIGFLFQQFSTGGEVVIEPFTIVNESGKQDDERGKALAQALQARLQSLVSELRSSEDEFGKQRTGAQAGASSLAVTVTPFGAATGANVSTHVSERLNFVKTSLLQPIDFKLSVAGLDVSGMLPWLQRLIFSRRTIHFAVFMQKDPGKPQIVAKVFGSVRALGIAREGLQLDVPGDGENSAPSPAKIADLLAHEILRQYMIQETTAQLELFTAEEFSTLTEILTKAALAKRQAAFANNADGGFRSIAPKVLPLADKTPSWKELIYFAAWIADNANEPTEALTYYRRAQTQFQQSKATAATNQITKRIEELTARVTPSDKLPPSQDNSAEFSIRNGGSEGSVVGQSLAAALDVQIARTTGQTRRMSARFIYYAARKIEGTEGSDAGARINDGIDVLKDQGTVEDSVWPYVAGQYAERPPKKLDNAPRFKIADAKQVSSIDQIKQAVVENGFAVIGVSVYDNFMSDEARRTGHVGLPPKSAQVIGGHAVVIVGYDDANKEVKFANSWGDTWGDHGFGYLPYEYVADQNLTHDGWTFKFAKPATASK